MSSVFFLISTQAQTFKKPFYIAMYEENEWHLWVWALEIDYLRGSRLGFAIYKNYFITLRIISFMYKIGMVSILQLCVRIKWDREYVVKHSHNFLNQIIIWTLLIRQELA